jgi:glycosyltransferase involved in cell wall biosynthesis
VFGAGASLEELDEFGPTKSMGHVSDDVTLAVLYNAADVFVAPSVEENLANTALESLACGTPVVAFRVGGFPDVIESRRNGYLAAPLNAADMAEGIRWALAELSPGMRDRCRQSILRDFTLQKQADRFIDLYTKVSCSK